MYRKNVEKEEGLTKNYYTFTVFDGGFFKGISSVISALDERHVVTSVLLIALGCATFLINKAIEAPTSPAIHYSSGERLQQCMSNHNNSDCMQAYDLETKRLKELSTELIRRETEELKQVEEKK